MEEIKLKLSLDLKNALKQKDTIAVKTIRSLMSAIDNAGAVEVETPSTMPMAGGIAGATDGLGSSEVPRKELSDEDMRQIIEEEIGEINTTIELLENHSHPQVAELIKQKELLKNYLY